MKKGTKNKTKRILFAVLIAIGVSVVLGFIAFGIKSLFTSGKDGEKETFESFEETQAELVIPENNGIYFASLSDGEKLVYNSVLTAALELKDTSEICKCSLDNEAFEKIADFVRADHPELFYVNFDELVLEDGGDEVYADMVYSVPKNEIPKMRSELENAVSSIIDECKCDEMSTELEKEIALHDALIQKCRNTTSNEILHNTAYGALVMNEAYCDGYAYAAKLLLNGVGIEAYAVYGFASEQGHIWNIVSIDGEYYHLDAMWDDANLTFAENMCFHGYFNLSDEAISKDHTEKYPEIMPKATAENDFYASTGRKAETLQQANEIFSRELINSINQGNYYVELLCEETSESEALTQCLVQCVKNIYGDSSNCPIYEYFTVYNASANSNAVTVQFYYK